MNWTNPDRRDRTAEGRTRRAAFDFDERTTTDLENEAGTDLLKWLFAAWLVILAAGLIIATIIFMGE